MGNKPPAFQFYVKDWRSSPTVQAMNRRQRGVYIDLLAAAWDSDEPGTLPLPVEVAAKIAMIDVRSLRDLLSKFPRCFVEVESIPGRIVNLKLRSQYEDHVYFIEKQRLAGLKGNAIRWHGDSQADRSASASASASAKSKPNPPYPPSKNEGGREQFFEWAGETVAVHLGRRRRLPSLSAYAGGRASDVVEFLNRRGFKARVARV